MCNVILRDPQHNGWGLSVTDDGRLVTSPIGLTAAIGVGPTLETALNNVWLLSVDNIGRILANPYNPPTIQRTPNYIPVVSSGGVSYKVVMLEPYGNLGTIPTSGTLPDFIPYIPDVSMSHWPDSIGVICAKCNNATVTVSADLSCWCCSCNSFIEPSDTNILVILDE